MKINELSKFKVMKPETIFTVQRSSLQRSVKLKINRLRNSPSVNVFIGTSVISKAMMMMMKMH